MVFQLSISDPYIANLILGTFPQAENIWVQSGIILLAFVVLAFVLRFVVEKLVLKIIGKTKTEVDDLIVDYMKKPLFFLIIVLGLRAAVLPLTSNKIILNIIESLSAIIFMYIIAGVVNILITNWGEKLASKTKTDLDETLLPLLHKAVNVILFVIVAIWVLSIWNIDITPYLAGLGIGGLVLGFALQDSLKNIFGGISLIIDRAYSVGDWIHLESGETGIIQDIGLRSTKLSTFDNQLIVVPNGQLANAKIQNISRPDKKLRVVVNFGAEYGAKIEKVKKTVETTLKKIKDISDDPAPDVIFTEMADFALLFQARFWVDDYNNAFAKKLEATEKIYNALNKAKIGIPFPTQTLYVKKQKN